MDQSVYVIKLKYNLHHFSYFGHRETLTNNDINSRMGPSTLVQFKRQIADTYV